jgi:hypothetical protein
LHAHVVMAPRALALLAVTLAATPAHALDRFEIQVYEDDVNDPGQFGLEVHLNYTARGTRAPEYPGNIPPYHVGRMTFEPAVGVLDWLELGAYLQFLWAPAGDTRFGGWKARAKLVVPERAGIPLMLGINVELSRVPAAVEQDRWGNEFRPIIGWRGSRWLVSVNPIFGWALTGPDAFRLDFEPAAKVSFDTRLGVAIGAEYYAGLGLVDDVLPVDEQEHVLLGVVDLVPRPPAQESPWELNLGIGGALTDAPGPHLVAKAIVGRSF